MTLLILSPAYGRDYKSQKALLADFNAGKDFIIRNFGHPYEGKPANKQDLKSQRVQFRFARDAKTFIHFVK